MHWLAKHKTALVVVIAIAIGGAFLITRYTTSANCNVAYLKLHGHLETYVPESDGTTTPGDETASEDLTQAIREADHDPDTQAIVMEVDSNGGEGVAAEEIQKALKNSKKPTISLIRQSGDSAAYVAATGAQVMFASPYSEVGGIGITSSYTDNSTQNAKQGVTFNQVSIGKYKDMFNPDKPLTRDERDLELDMLRVYYDDMIRLVAHNRHLDPSAIAALADGSTMPGEKALRARLIDKLGGIDEVRSYLAQKLDGEAVICGVGVD